MSDMEKNSCASCKWCERVPVGDDMDYICVNDSSSYLADWVFKDFVCDCYEREEGV